MMKTIADLRNKINAICHENYMKDRPVNESFTERIDLWKNGIVLLESGMSEEGLIKQRDRLTQNRIPKNDIRLEVLDFILST